MCGEAFVARDGGDDVRGSKEEEREKRGSSSTRGNLQLGKNTD
jgi:hypothetical protein